MTAAIIFVNDKANCRVARIRCDIMKTDKIIEIPNASDIHGLRPQKYPRTGYVFANSEHIIPIPNDGRRCSTIRRNYWSVFTAIDGDTMEVAWQVLVDGNLDNTDADYQGKYAFSTCYNPNKGTTLAEMTDHEQAWAVVFNIKRIEQAVKDRRLQDDQRRQGRRRPTRLEIHALYPDSQLAPRRQHRAGRHPCRDQRQAVADRQRASTCASSTISSTTRSRSATSSSPSRSSALGRCTPHSTARATPSRPLFIDSQIVKWNIDKAKRAFAGEKVDPILQKIDVHYQPGHNHTSMGETKEADGKWLLSLNKFSKDRFLNVGPLNPNNDQLIDISGDKMELVHDGPAFAEPHDLCIVHRSKINPISVWKRDDPMFEDARKWAAKDGVKLEEAANVIRDGNKVRVYMHSNAPQYSLDKIRGERGRRGHGLPHQHGRHRGPDPRLHHRALRRDDGDLSAGDGVGHLHRRPPRRALVVLPVVLPRPAHGNVRSA